MLLRHLLLTAFLAVAAAFPDRAEPAPATNADEDVEITLQRTACYGSCPDYTVTIDGKGNVRFRTQADGGPGAADVHRAYSWSDGVLVSGDHRDQIDPAVVRDLVAQFRAADFFGLKNKYESRVTDNPAYILTFRQGGRTKQVVDYVGRQAGMPASVTALEDAVDKAAGTARWVVGAEGLVPWLEREGFDFTSQQARDMALAGALGMADDGTIIALIEHGATLDGKASFPYGDRKGVLGKELALAAVSKGRAALFTWLAARGWVELAGVQGLEMAFADASASCSPALVEAFARSGLGVDAPGEEGETALTGLANNSYHCRGDDEALVAIARALLDAGADPNHRNDAGETAIFDVEYLPLLELLYARGARADIADKEGNSAVFSSWTDEIVLRHLEAGASAKGRYYDGRSLEEQMKERPMPRVRQWLKDHSETPR